jgi:ribonuclease HII
MTTQCGLDEVGRGALAGPIVAACVLLSDKHFNELCSSHLIIRDSKTLSIIQREKIFERISELKIPYATVSISAHHINQKGIQWANCEIMYRLIKKYKTPEYIVDGTLKLSSKGKKIICAAHADATVPAVMLAGIVAKITRDNYMMKLHKKTPIYGWNTNVGYGTKKHIQSVIKFGKTKYHRTHFVQTAVSHFLIKQNGI